MRSRSIIQRTLARISLTDSQKAEIAGVWKLHLAALHDGEGPAAEDYQRVFAVSSRIESEYLAALPRSEKVPRVRAWSEDRLREWDLSLGASENEHPIFLIGGKERLEWVRIFFEEIRDRTALTEALIIHGDLPRAWVLLKGTIALVTKMNERFDGLRAIPAIRVFRDLTVLRGGDDSIFMHSKEVEAQFEAALVPVQK